MVYLYDPDYIGNPMNRKYVRMAGLLEMDAGSDWKFVREMYESLHSDVKKELDSYFVKVELMRTTEYLRKLHEYQNRGSISGLKFCTRGAA